MSEERLPAAPSGELGEAATCRDYTHVRQEGARQLEQRKLPAPKREKGGKA